MRKSRALVFPILLVLGGCDQVSEWFAEHFASHDQADRLEARVAQLEKQTATIQASVEGLKQAVDPTASSFDECVLAHMKGVNSDAAALAIKESCLSSVSKPLVDISPLAQSSAQYGEIFGSIGRRHFGLYIHLRNNTPFTITEVGIEIQEVKTQKANFYNLRYFSPPVEPGVILGGPPSDPTSEMQLGRGESLFTMEVNESIDNSMDFFKRYRWDIVSAKGFVR
jgi:hypothetical protein